MYADPETLRFYINDEYIKKGVAHVFREFEGRGHQKFSLGAKPQDPHNVFAPPINCRVSATEYKLISSYQNFIVLVCKKIPDKYQIAKVHVPVIGTFRMPKVGNLYL